jgi:hypothetical protein
MDDIRLNALVEKYKHPLLIRSSQYKDRSVDFTLKGKNKNWDTRFEFDELFPFSLPKVWLLEDGFIGKITHINIKGVLCINESDSIVRSLFILPKIGLFVSRNFTFFTDW